MTRRAASLLALVVLGACGGPSSEPARTPSWEPKAATVGSPAADVRPASSPATEPAKVEATGWPFGPAQGAEERAAQLQRLAKDAGPIRSNWVPPGKTERYGHAEAMIGAPLETVRERLVDFTHYKDLAGPKFKTVRIVEKDPGRADLYFQLPIMKGIVTLWYVTRFGQGRPLPDGGQVVEGTFVKGNIKDMHIVFTTRPGDGPKSTVLVCDLLLVLNIPAPPVLVDEELRDACGDALNAIRVQSTRAP